MNVNELTRKLIDIPSVTGDEQAVGEFLQSHLADLGYSVRRQQVTAERFNVFATTNAKPEIVLSTHMDTVPLFIASSEDGEKIYGRGACDAKGIIAAQIHAAERLRELGINEFGLLFTVDEETGSAGAQLANADEAAATVRHLINGEPTDNKLASATKGSLRLKLLTEGVAAHSAYPERGDSAIEKLLEVLADIRSCDWPSDERLGLTTCNIGVIRGGTRSNVVPAEAAAELHLRLVSPTAPIKAMLESAVAGRAKIEYLSAHEPVHLLTVEGFEQCVVRFTTDIPYLSQWGKPLLLGPGSILNAHTDHEFVSKKELAAAVELYVSLLRGLLSKDEITTRDLEAATK
jgi:acetylornithine deacetylase